MKYPYIGGINSDCKVLFMESSKGVAIEHPDDNFVGIIYDRWFEMDFKNITREYLEGKCVKIESPEHSEFAQRLAFNAGFKWADGDDRITKMSVGSYLNFRLEIGLTYSSCVDYEQIKIPLPPKAESEPKDWPQVGDEFIHESKLVTCISRCETSKGDDVVVFESDNGCSIGSCWNNDTWVKKPKTEAEILRDDLIELTLSHMENKRHPIEANAYYLVSEIIDKYITKKPQ